MNDKYSTLYFEVAAMFADCGSEPELRDERHRITDIVAQVALDRLNAITQTETNVP